LQYLPTVPLEQRASAELTAPNPINEIRIAVARIRAIEFLPALFAAQFSSGGVLCPPGMPSSFMSGSSTDQGGGKRR
jgi:hypothetical protein